jgi:hypothetical protein
MKYAHVHVLDRLCIRAGLGKTEGWISIFQAILLVLWHSSLGLDVSLTQTRRMRGLTAFETHKRLEMDRDVQPVVETLTGFLTQSWSKLQRAST